MGDISDYFTRITRKTTCLRITESKSEIRGGGIPGNFRWGAWFSKSEPNFRPKNFHFPRSFLDLAKNHTRLQTWRRQKLCYHYLDLNAN